MKNLYLASPYGFTSSGIEFMNNKIVPLLKKKFLVLNPWDSLFSNQKTIEKILANKDPIKKFSDLRKINESIALENLKLLDKSDVVAVLDGSDVDSGVAAEIGYAYSKGKLIVGYRSDFILYLQEDHQTSLLLYQTIAI